jgi:hypothetical protein
MNCKEDTPDKFVQYMLTAAIAPGINCVTTRLTTHPQNQPSGATSAATSTPSVSTYEVGISWGAATGAG